MEEVLEEKTSSFHLGECYDIMTLYMIHYGIYDIDILICLYYAFRAWVFPWGPQGLAKKQQRGEREVNVNSFDFLPTQSHLQIYI